jgi:fatty acid desaturase
MDGPRVGIESTQHTRSPGGFSPPGAVLYGGGAVQPRRVPSELQRRFAEAFRLRPAVYWTDLLLSAALGWGAFAVAAASGPGTSWHAAALVVSTLALLRAALFIHELAHLAPGRLPGFELVWNALVGIPIAVPSLMYVGSHLDHHRPAAFGTGADPEYALIARWGRARIAGSVLAMASLPVLLPLRWAVVGPVSRAVPALRPLVVGKLSTLAVDPAYTRPAPIGRHATRWAVQEAAAALVFLVAGAALALGVLPWSVAAQWAFVVGALFVLNQVRTLVAHGYDNSGEAVDAEGQLLDSINLGGVLLEVLLAPVGLRYHALHHHLPGLPYHSLGRVHRELLATLPDDSPYRRTLRAGLLPALARLWRRASTAPAPT